jgi:hypothetical protein
VSQKRSAIVCSLISDLHFGETRRQQRLYAYLKGVAVRTGPFGYGEISHIRNPITKTKDQEHFIRTNGSPAVIPLGVPNESHVSSSPAVTKRASARTQAAPANRRGTRGAGQQLQRRTTHDVRSRSSQDQPGAKSSMGEGEGPRAEAEENDLSGGAPENCGGAESAVGEGKERSLKGAGGGDPKPIGSAGGGFTPLSQRPQILSEEKHYSWSTMSSSEL